MSFLYEQSNNKNVKVENAESGIYNFVFYKIILKSKSADQKSKRINSIHIFVKLNLPKYNKSCCNMLIVHLGVQVHKTPAKGGFIASNGSYDLGFKSHLSLHHHCDKIARIYVQCLDILSPLALKNLPQIIHFCSTK